MTPAQVLTLADSEGAKVSERWDGSLCIGSDAARKLRQDQEAERQREMELQVEHRTWLADRTARRQAAVKTAQDEALKKALAEQMDHARKINSGEIESEWATGGRIRGRRGAEATVTKSDSHHRAATAQWPEQASSPTGLIPQSAFQYPVVCA